ncbi:MAG TPA: hypothetical protein VD947_02565 [Patescibacteria group bacterium]|nr:hypothetical protein [Patescibacteria group bacterium]
MVYKAKEGIIKEKLSRLSLFFVGMMLALAASLTVFSSAQAADSTVRVTGNTVDESAGENGSSGWWFNRDTNTDTPYEFNTDEASIGSGSLYVKPISSNPADKFIAEYFYFEEIANVNSISYDFKTDNESDVDQFYLNLYVNDGNDPTEFYDCRYEIVPSSLNPDPTTGFTTFTYDLSDPASSVTQRSTSNINPCPISPSDLPDGAVLRAISINVGDSSANDTNLSGHLDNVVLNTASGTTTYDFEPEVQRKEDCKNGGYATYGFRNQGLCIQYMNTGKDSRI